MSPGRTASAAPLLLDTHVFLWWAAGQTQRLTPAQRERLERTPDAYLSIASVWEIAIKAGLGKLAIRPPLGEFVRTQLAACRLTLLPIDIEHAERSGTLPWHHRDPFDRLLVAQALCAGFALVSADPALDAYGVMRVC